MARIAWQIVDVPKRSSITIGVDCERATYYYYYGWYCGKCEMCIFSVLYCVGKFIFRVKIGRPILANQYELLIYNKYGP